MTTQPTQAAQTAQTAQTAVCLRRGSGPATVLLHGFTGSPTSFTRAAALAPSGPPVWGLALPGHHPALPVATDFETNVNAIAERIQSISLNAHVIGYSLGARIAAGLVANHPSILRQATLVGVHPGLTSENERHARREADASWIELLESAGIDEFVRRWELLPLWSTQRDLDRSLLAEQRRLRLSHDPVQLADVLRHLGLAAMPDFRTALQSSTVPVELVTGDRDLKFGAIAESLGLPHRMARGIGHNVVLEDPSSLWPTHQL